jgi:hypothetical protein
VIRGLGLIPALALGLTVAQASIGRCADRAIERLESLGRALDGENAWESDFEQEFTPAGMTLGEVAAGRVWLAWPDRALFHTGDPPSRLMAFQGRIAKLVDVEAQTCDEHRLSDREWERVPLVAVLNPTAAVDHFTVFESETGGIILVPRDPGGVDRVEVVLGEDHLPVEVTIWDPQGAVNRLRFTAWAASDGPPADRWLPEAPEGVDCITDPGALD